MVRKPTGSCFAKDQSDKMKNEPWLQNTLKNNSVVFFTASSSTAARAPGHPASALYRSPAKATICPDFFLFLHVEEPFPGSPDGRLKNIEQL
jgi:hypothetical protein